MNKKIFIGIIICLLVNASFISGGYPEETDQIGNDVREVCEPQEDVVVTCRTFGFPGEPSQEVAMPLEEAEFLYNKLKELQIEIARDPLSDKTQELQHDIITLADDYGLLSASVSTETIQSRLTPSWHPQCSQIAPLPHLQNRVSELFCNFVSTGSGSSLPVITLPRLVPILLTPIPRLFIGWSATEGMTSCGGLLSGTGFIAYGQQKGLALGFWGIGFSIFLPPVMAYGLFGYALFARVNAEEIEFYPPNRAPVISNENPSNWAYNVSTSLSELSFKIEDADGDRMSYSVTTDPDIGSDSENNKNNGFYSVSVSGLEPDKLYIWTVEVDDGKDTVKKDFTFFTGEPPYEILFSDDFDDNTKDYSKWTEIYTNGTWKEINQRTEFKLYEPGSGRTNEGIESSEFTVSLSPSEPIVVSCDMITEIESTNWVGDIRLEVTDGTNWIWMAYNRYRDWLKYVDSNDEKYTVFNSNKPDGSWDNEIQICSDKYYIRMDSDDSGWVYDSIFSSNPTLSVRIYLQTAGSTPSVYMHSGFDNVMVRAPR